MIEQKEIELLKSKLPRGYRRILADRTQFSTATIRRFFIHIPLKQRTYEAIYEACLEIIEEASARREYRKNRLQRLVARDKQKQSSSYPPAS